MTVSEVIHKIFSVGESLLAWTTVLFVSWNTRKKWIVPAFKWIKAQVSLDAKIDKLKADHAKDVDALKKEIDLIRRDLQIIQALARMSYSASFIADENGYITGLSVACLDMIGMDEHEAKGLALFRAVINPDPVKKSWLEFINDHKSFKEGAMFDEFFTVRNQRTSIETKVNARADWTKSGIVVTVLVVEK